MHLDAAQLSPATPHVLAGRRFVVLARSLPECFLAHASHATNFRDEICFE
jgi:hypothetical protein